MLTQPTFDYAAPHFLPIELDLTHGVSLSAGGRTVHLDGPLFAVEAAGTLETRQDITPGEFIVCSLTLTARVVTLLRRVAWCPGAWSGMDEHHISRTNLQDTVLFLRAGEVSFFLSLDFPCSTIDVGGIAYPPNETLPGGGIYVAHTLTIGACRLSGVRVGELDRAEIEAVSAYIERRFPPRFNRPLFTSSCITNRMTECRDGRVFYSMHDNPTLALNPKLLAEDVRLMAQIGVEYFQVFEGQFDWPDERHTGAALRRLVALGRRLGVRIGDYVNPQGLYCMHYNYAHRELDRPEWRQVSADGSLGNYCLGSRDYLDSFVPQLIGHNRTYGEEFICFDFLDIRPCHAAHHGHPVGDVYAQVKALVEIFQALNALSPEYLVWSNSGNWLELMPKLVWWNHNVYLTDPHVREYAPGLNGLKFLDDGRREQMVTVHDGWFVPWRAFTNCEYYAFPRSRVHDLHVYEYSFLQGLAVTPNICPAETRVFLNRVPSAKRTEIIRFMRRWTDYIRAHFDVWQHTARVGDAPGVGATEIYAHVRDDNGVICLVNQNPFTRTARFTLDGRIGLSAGERFALREIYPRECPMTESPLPYAAYGDEITCDIPPHGVRYLEITPYTEPEGVQVYGLPARVRRTRSGYRVTLRAPQGQVVPLGIVLPPGETLADVSVRPLPTVPMYTFPVAARVTARDGNLARVDVTFPREAAPRALTRWRVSPGDVDVELPQLDTCEFLGGLITNAFSEDYAVQLDLRVESTETATGRLCPNVPSMPPTQVVPSAKRQTFTTDFVLPFIEHPGYGMLPDANDDTVLELAFRDPARVGGVTARLNDAPISVQCYRYPKRRDWRSWYLDLTGQAHAGPQHLEITIEWT